MTDSLRVWGSGPRLDCCAPIPAPGLPPAHYHATGCRVASGMGLSDAEEAIYAERMADWQADMKRQREQAQAIKRVRDAGLEDAIRVHPAGKGSTSQDYIHWMNHTTGLSEGCPRCLYVDAHIDDDDDKRKPFGEGA